MHMQLQSEFKSALSPVREAAAYEALWDGSKASVKSIAEQVLKNKEDFHPATLVEPTIIDDYVQKLLKLISNSSKRFDFHFLGEADYPAKLLDAKYPVPLLYYIGAWDLIYSPSIAVVGTRNPTEEGIRRTQKLVKNLVDDNYTIVSGLAKGIDTAAHQAAMSCDGRTIAVIGTSILDNYPKENRELQDKIASEYLLISQVPLFRYQKQTYKTNRFFFPERNKTMSALTLGTVIVEASETSGSLIQARAAIEQGRKLFILDNCFRNSELTWPKKLEGLGGIRVKNYQDIQDALKS